MSQPTDGLTIRAPGGPAVDAVLTPGARVFVAELARAFAPRIRELRAARQRRAEALRAGASLDFLPETRAIREGNWRCAPLPQDLVDRRVEITGPADRKMIINALNSGANVFMADLEDSHAPTWANTIDGQQNLMDAVRRTITFEGGGKKYALNEKTAVLLVRPRGFHLHEKHLEVDGEVVPGMLVDFGLYFFHNAKELLARGTGPYFYLPKMESHLEARLWNDLFVHAQSGLGLPLGTIKATCLVETLPAAFQLHEILYALRDHSAGLNCGRWDYIFSYIKTLADRKEHVLPDRAAVTMTQPCMRAYTRLVIQTCHRRGVHAMGGMAAQIPIKSDEAKNAAALEKVRADKLREVEDGHDGTWVAHPGLVAIAREIFDAHMKTDNQIASGKQADLVVTAKDLLETPTGPKTLEGLRHNIKVGVQYVEAWLRGTGCVPLYDLMEDAATAEISRTQIWQWVRHQTTLDDGTRVTKDLVASCLREEMEKLAALGVDVAGGRFPEAQKMFFELATSSELTAFLTLPAYDALVRFEA
jgi:malate synthase